MAIVENPLSDHEIDEICHKPRRKKTDVFGPAEEWLEKNREQFARVKRGKYLLMNAADMTYVLDENHDKANEQYKDVYGPTPPAGRNFLGVVFP